MHAFDRGRIALLTAIVAVVALVGVLPMFSGTAYASGVNLNQSVAISFFIIPGAPLARTTAALDAVQQPPFLLTASSDISPPLFPKSGQLLISGGNTDLDPEPDDWGQGDKPGAELMSYDNNSAAAACAGRTPMQFCITERAPTKLPGTAKKPHPEASKVKLATVSESAISGTDGAQTRMTDADVGAAGLQDMTAVRGGCTPVAGETFANRAAITPFLVQLASTANFPASGHITISHQDVQTSNQGGVGPGQSAEMLAYDMVGAGANQIRITDRGLQPDNRCYPHKRDGFAQPSQSVSPSTSGHPGVTKVSVHFQLNVKSAVGFFPASNLLVCDPTNPLTNCELLGHNNRITKIKTPVEDGAGGAQDQFHMTGRCADAGTFNKAPHDPGDTTVCSFPVHPVGSIVTGADAFVNCRNGSSQPGVDTDLGTAGYQEPPGQAPNTSVGVNAVCYPQSQPKGGTPKGKGHTIVGQDLLVLSSIQGQPFLSTGGFNHVVLGPVPHVDTDGPKGDANDCDADGITAELVLCLVSPCIPDFTPGTNLQVRTNIQLDTVVLGLDVGRIRVVLDTVTGPGGGADGNPATHDECDDPAGTDFLETTVYDSTTAEPLIDKDDDTDRDGCSDERELRSILNQGGLRDPWNPYDWYDINHDGAVSIPVDILQVAQAFGVPANYAPRKDRGALNFGPFSWNKSGPNGSIDVPGDVLGVAQQFSSACLHDPNTATATHETYDTGTAWPNGNGPWYGLGVVPNH